MPPPPLPAKSVQRGRSEPQISVITQDGSNLRRRSSNPASHTSTPQIQARHASSLPNSESPSQSRRPPKSPHGQGCLQKTHRQTWDGQTSASSGSQSSFTPVSPQNPAGPVSSEKTTSYRRSSGGSSQGRCVGSQEELYCSPGENNTSSSAPSSSSPTATCSSRSRRNAMVSGTRPLKRVKALVDCRAVSSEQLAFFKDEVIVVTTTNDPHWWVGHIDGDPLRSGTFPVNYVHKLTD
ncbi:arf-GAP with SH3 domain, ANK repeat and PH domain-containing protein 2 [Nematolebias whitei]|uniref:arf-GAP with SH3 domain, ANK repeat and PH domain-containing protein 2 n=1 Tax=Nematolebias whitei TaxID=451745 RepID=UPI00189A7AC0|nr:arf-GAP with SH3 domain, ANK repeat and PH domain-containing protein 2 [Nematolebias whitei]